MDIASDMHFGRLPRLVLMAMALRFYCTEQVVLFEKHVHCHNPQNSQKYQIQHCNFDGMFLLLLI